MFKTHNTSRCILPGVLFLASLLAAGSIHATDPWYAYTIHLDQNGIATVAASLQLPTPLQTSYDVLSDYPHWPTLFANHPIVNTIDRSGDRVTVDMTIPGLIFPLDLQLVTETLEIPPVRLTTTFIEGDFDRYAWVWHLSSSDNKQHTHAALELQVKPSIWAPQWVFRTMLEQELEEHFQKLRHQVLLRQRAKQLSSIISAMRNAP